MFKMRTILLALMGLFAISTVAIAGDINSPAPVFPIKAASFTPAPNPCDNNGCSGLVAGFEMSGSGTGINVLNLGQINAGGQYMGASFGYQMWNGKYFLGAKIKADYEVYIPGAAPISGFTNKLFVFEGAEVGGNLAGLFSNAATPISLPGPLANAVPTLLVGACQHGNLQGYCAGAAAHFFIPNSRWTVDADYLNAQYGQTTVGVNATASTENRGTFGFSYHF